MSASAELLVNLSANVAIKATRLSYLLWYFKCTYFYIFWLYTRPQTFDYHNVLRVFPLSARTSFRRECQKVQFTYAEFPWHVHLNDVGSRSGDPRSRGLDKADVRNDLVLNNEWVGIREVAYRAVYPSCYHMADCQKMIAVRAC